MLGFGLSQTFPFNGTLSLPLLTGIQQPKLLPQERGASAEQRPASGFIYNCSIGLAETKFRILYHFYWIREVWVGSSSRVGDAKSNLGKEIKASWVSSANSCLQALQSFHLPLWCFSLELVSSLELWFLVFTDDLTYLKESFVSWSIYTAGRKLNALFLMQFKCFYLTRILYFTSYDANMCIISVL